ncbi:MAG: hypothetical protein KA794_19880 [Candidatus Obscuribacter sp.]|nr:hypothetical protein [Candidatus Obscuribacter sp.]
MQSKNQSWSGLRQSLAAAQLLAATVFAKASCSDRADGVSYRTIVYFGTDNNPTDGQNPPQD